MDDSIMDGGFQSSWMELIAWLDWLQPFLYCLLGIVVVCLLLALLDLAFLCWKGFRSPQAQRTRNDHKKAAPASEVGEASQAA
ncbi:MAG: hypothetical protein SF339_22740 [Blastocatellia bacterium]|nr:hypothetical protein [Blastocatellia bacterium]